MNEEIGQVIGASKRVKNFIAEYNRTPLTIKLNNDTVSRASFNRMMGAALNELLEDRSRDILKIDIKPPIKPLDNLKQGIFVKEEYKDWNRRALTYMNDKQVMPNFIRSKLGEISPFSYMDMVSRILSFYGDFGNLPSFVKTQRELAPKPTPEDTGFLAELKRALGRGFNSASELWNLVRGYPYSYYYNSRYTEPQRLERIRNKQGMNCTDWSLVLYKALKLMGYTVQAVRGLVRCSSGNIGHVWLEIMGKEFRNWVYYDSTTATSQKGNINRLVCPLVQGSRTYNPNWFMELV